MEKITLDSEQRQYVKLLRRGARQMRKQTVRCEGERESRNRG